MQPRKKISFCTTSRNRLWQLKETLANNVSHLGDECEITLVDYGSADGMSDWVWKNFEESIKAGKLNFFEVRNEVRWNVSRAKNLAHRLSNGTYLFNLDADNFITPADIRFIDDSRARNRPCHQWTEVFRDGSFGRIGVPRDLFFELGGYDESLLPMGGQDMDLIERIEALGWIVARSPLAGCPAVKNNFEDKVREFNPSPENAAALYETVNKLNIQKTKIRLEIEGPKIVDGFSTFRGLLNGAPIVIDGFNRMRADD
jgi:hypothetical protein